MTRTPTGPLPLEMVDDKAGVPRSRIFRLPVIPGTRRR
jgi:hypothetical protein